MIKPCQSCRKEAAPAAQLLLHSSVLAWAGKGVRELFGHAAGTRPVLLLLPSSHGEEEAELLLPLNHSYSTQSRALQFPVPLV